MCHNIDLLVADISGKLEYKPSLSIQEVLDMALGFEKDTLLYFNELRTLFSGEDSAVVNSLCREEKNHIRMLMSYKQKTGLK